MNVTYYLTMYELLSQHLHFELRKNVLLFLKEHFNLLLIYIWETIAY